MNVDQLNFLNSFGSGDAKRGQNVADMNASIRLKFLRKVYSILAVQLTMNTLVSGFILFSPQIKAFAVQNNWVLFLNLGLSIVSMLGLMWKRRDYPINFVLLGLTTLCQSFSVGILVSFYDRMLVFQAFMLTAAITVGLTVYTFTAKNDFTWLGSTLVSLLGATFVAGIAQIFLRSPLVETGLSLVGAVIFSLFIIYDTQLVMKHISPEDYIIAVLNLYLDIVNLFIKILRLLKSNNSNSEGESNERRKKRSD